MSEVIGKVLDTAQNSVKRALKWVLYAALIIFGAGVLLGLYIANNQTYFYICAAILIVIAVLEAIDLYVDASHLAKHKSGAVQ